MSTALKNGYATIAEADAFLDGDVNWKLTSSIRKTEALQFGRYYIDANYQCPYLDPNDPSESVKYANALYALDYINGELFNADSPSDISVKRVKAGPVETETEFENGQRTIKNEKAQTLLSDECIYYGEGAVKTNSAAPIMRR